ncbi:MAG: DEAD/DEAH box helicase [Burkholderiaceae bacterium]|jgi:superfamily II DNA/RNA helicase|nr:DEAD/DEAH box helicase [Burkholderiaceae bacterium]
MSDDQKMAEQAAPALRFTDFGLDEKILRALNEQGYISPTPIQEKAIPIVLQGRDVMGAAQTGTGKTAGFSLPLIQMLLPLANTSMSPARHPVRALILTPTRELADQVADNVRNYARYTGLRSAVVFGGVDMAPQTAALRAGVEILIATPGRLLDHVQQKSLNLSQTSILVLDEADRMLDMGFLPDLQRIINLLPKKRQNLMFSATFSTEIKKLAGSFLSHPATIEVARSNAAADTVSQTVYQVDEASKSEAVAYLIHSRNLEQVLIFTNTRIGASRLTRLLEKKGIRATAIHGDKSQPERMAALEAFKKGEIDALVATDVAARGLDIVELPCVMNYDLPFAAEDYVHRIGRTGRAGASGDAISLYSAKDERCLADIEKLIRRKLPRVALPGFGDGARPASGGREPGQREGRQGAPASGRRAGRGSPPDRKRKHDPWFDKPYEPAVSAVEIREEAVSTAVAKAPGKKVAALLGGLPKK